jgi:hypothetical protein
MVYDQVGYFISAVFLYLSTSSQFSSKGCQSINEALLVTGFLNYIPERLIHFKLLDNF